MVVVEGQFIEVQKIISHILALLHQFAEKSKSTCLPTSKRELRYIGECCLPSKDNTHFENTRWLLITDRVLIITSGKSITKTYLFRVIPLTDITGFQNHFAPFRFFPKKLGRPHVSLRYQQQQHNGNAELVIATVLKRWIFPQMLQGAVFDAIVRQTQKVTLISDPRDVAIFKKLEQILIHKWHSHTRTSSKLNRWEERRRRFQETNAIMIEVSKLAQENTAVKESFWNNSSNLYQVIVDSLEDSFHAILSYIKQHTLHSKKNVPYPSNDPFHLPIQMLRKTKWIPGQVPYIPPSPPSRPAPIPIDDVTSAIRYSIACLFALISFFQDSECVHEVRDLVVFQSKSPYGYGDVLKIVIAGINLRFADKLHSLDDQAHAQLPPDLQLIDELLVKMRLSCISLIWELLRAAKSYQSRCKVTLPRSSSQSKIHTCTVDMASFLVKLQPLSNLGGLMDQCIQLLIHFHSAFGDEYFIHGDDRTHPSNRIHENQKNKKPLSSIQPTPSTMVLVLKASFIVMTFLGTSFPVPYGYNLPRSHAKLSSLYGDEIKYAFCQMKKDQSESKEKAKSLVEKGDTLISRKSARWKSTTSSADATSQLDAMKEMEFHMRSHKFVPALREIRVCVQRLTQNLQETLSDSIFN